MGNTIAIQITIALQRSYKLPKLSFKPLGYIKAIVVLLSTRVKHTTGFTPCFHNTNMMSLSKEIGGKEVWQKKLDYLGMFS